ncbi:uncharacterized protein LY89DRAFT_338512 [Mollisia scopiformis]|uniref:Uncharacterized protein n=1 Tax=Mollisia scopiformis TaxID=149040 RepID=A0A132B8M5_MOLSC|nr:uncharacterized protein LY89DRAFT_338512 [Mollisia scopiformis]KUJ08234.1 hypothetical protein LY89DRAFT_338512 [Mollisia scopiformis]
MEKISLGENLISLSCISRLTVITNQTYDNVLKKESKKKTSRNGLSFKITRSLLTSDSTILLQDVSHLHPQRFFSHGNTTVSIYPYPTHTARHQTPFKLLIEAPNSAEEFSSTDSACHAKTSPSSISFHHHTNPPPLISYSLSSLSPQRHILLSQGPALFTCMAFREDYRHPCRHKMSRLPTKGQHFPSNISPLSRNPSTPSNTLPIDMTPYHISPPSIPMRVPRLCCPPSYNKGPLPLIFFFVPSILPIPPRANNVIFNLLSCSSTAYER